MSFTHLWFFVVLAKIESQSVAAGELGKLRISKGNNPTAAQLERLILPTEV